MKFQVKNLAAIALWSSLASFSSAQNAPATQPADQPQPTEAAPAPAAPTTLPTPAITGPLQGLPPAIFDAGPFGKIAVNGIVSGTGMWQGNHVPGDSTTQAALSNGQVFIQKTDGWFQFYMQAGAYTTSGPGDAVPRHRQNTDQLLRPGARSAL